MKTRIMAVALGVLLFLAPSRVGAFGHCDADLNGDGEIGPADLAMLLASWGPCPFCGDGNVDPGEDCDPPDGKTCDENCLFIPTNCCSPHLFSGCEEPICESLVCDLDPFCCDTEWDFICATAAAELCPVCFGIDCCFSHVSTGCTDPVCEALVCAFFPSCCKVAWNASCADLAADLCERCGSLCGHGF